MSLHKSPETHAHQIPLAMTPLKSLNRTRLQTIRKKDRRYFQNVHQNKLHYFTQIKK